MRRPRSGPDSGSRSRPDAPGRARASATQDADEAAPARPARSGKRRRRLRLSPTTAIALLIVLGALGYVGYWAYIALTIKSGLAAAIEAQRAEGLEITHGPAQLTGFPLHAQAVLSDVSMVASPDRGGWTYATKRVTLTVRPHDPYAIRIALNEAPHHLSLPDGPTTRTTALAEIGAGTLVVTLSNTGRLRALSIEADDATVRVQTAPGGVSTGDPGLVPAEGDTTAVHTLDRITLDYAHRKLWNAEARDLTHSLSASLSNLTLAPDPRLALGRTVAAARLEAAVLGPLPHDRDPQSALRVWQEAGGRVRLDHLSVTWDPLALTAAGLLALDQGLQPEGTLNARISGFVDLIDSLHQKGLIRGRDATMAKVLLGSQARPDSAGRARLEVPLIIRDGALRAGPVVLMPVPPLPWAPARGSLGAEGVTPGFSIDRDGQIVPNR